MKITDCPFCTVDRSDLEKIKYQKSNIVSGVVCIYLIAAIASIVLAIIHFTK